MKNDPLFGHLAQLLPEKPTGSPVPKTGGCIHQSWQWGPYFIKTNTLQHLANFQSEANSLKTIQITKAIRVPEVILIGETSDSAFLVLEHLQLLPRGNESMLGEQLAALHGHTADQFGFPENNFIGATHQPNCWSNDWPSFFRDHRIGHLLKLLKQKGIEFPKSGELLKRLPELLPQISTASLLHGDLWSGNKAFLQDGTPVIFDPACYYGHAACDMAMTGLFGGFSRSFHDSYHDSSELDDPSLHEVYNLYHLLNHALLFGGAYVDQAGIIIRRLA